MLAGMEASIRWVEPIPLIFVNAWWQRLRPVACRVTGLQRNLALASARRSGGWDACGRPAALLQARLAVTNHGRLRVSTASGCWLGSRRGDFTLRGLVAELAARGLKVDYRSVWAFVHAEKLSFKKKRGGWRTRAS